MDSFKYYKTQGKETFTIKVEYNCGCKIQLD